MTRSGAGAGAWLGPLRTALDAAPAPVAFFLRDDDAGWDDERLFATLDVIGRRALPLDLAVIPRALSPELAESLMARADDWGGRLALHQHGFAHSNHEVEGRKCEFGAARDHAGQRRDIAAGRELLEERLPGLVQPVFTPPWNRCTADTGAVLRELGFRVLSRDAGAPALAQPGLEEVPVSVDWSFAKRRGARLDWAELGRLAAGCARGGGPVGINLHHAEMDDAELGLLAELCDVLDAHESARCRPLLAVAPSTREP